MLGLTPLGTVHTAISLIALAAGLVALWRQQEISTRTRSGIVFVAGTALSCLTGLFIFQRGGFGIPHVLALVTLVVLAVALLAEHRRTFGRSRATSPRWLTRSPSSSTSFPARWRR